MKIKKKSIRILLLTLFCSLMAALGCMLMPSSSATPSLLAVSELFLPSDMTLTHAVIAEGSETTEAGLMISTTSKQSTISLKHAVTGEFSTRFSPIVKNGSPTVTKVVFNVVDADSACSFDIVVQLGVMSNVSVELDGEQVGVVYEGSKMRGLTNLGNLSGVYTRQDSRLTSITFDPETMGVYLGEGESKKLVWDLTEDVIDGQTASKTFDKFKSYTVSVGYPEYVGETGDIVFYSICGNVLDKMILNGYTSPQFFADYKYKGLVGEKYIVPTGYAFDICSGAIKDVESVVVDPQGNEFELKNGVFTPKIEGNYNVIYTAKNVFNVTASRAYAIEVLSEMPVYEYTMSEELPEEVSVGETLHIPQMKVTAGMLMDGSDVATVTLYINGIKQVRFSDVRSGFDFVFSGKGVYRFVYNVGSDTVIYRIRAYDDGGFTFNYSFDDNYSMNDYVDISSAELQIDGVKTGWSATVTYPDGRVYKNNQFELNQSGTYVVKVIAENSEKTAKEYEFSVKEKSQDLFSVVAEGASVGYGTSAFTGKSGVYVKTTTTATEITYNQLVDISKYVNQTKPNNKNQVLFGEDKVYIADDAIPLISMSIEPNNFKSQVMRKFSIRIEDSEDPTNAIVVDLDTQNSSTWTYVRAKAGTQGLAGWLETSNKLYTVDHGFLVAHSTSGFTNSEFTAADSKIELYYDNEEKQILAYSGKDVKKQGKTNSIIADFDNPELSNGLPWSGFTSDKVRISITLGTVTSSAGCYIYTIDGADLTKEDLVYTTPDIRVDMPQTDGVEQSSLVGIKGNIITLPRVIAYDFLGNELAGVKSQVYYLSGNEEYNISVTDGKFNTSRSGKYLIKYYVYDKFYNYAERSIYVDVYDTYSEMTVSGTVGSEYKTGKTGTPVELWDTSDLTVTNALGAIDVCAKVTYSSEEISISENRFVPEKVGEYTVTYTVTDYVGRKVDFSYKVNVSLENKPVVVSAIPEYVGFINGNTYEIYDVLVMDYTDSSNLTAKKAEVYIDGKLFSGNIYTPEQIAAEGKDTEEIIAYTAIEYKYKGQVIDGLNYVVPVRNPYKLGTKLVGKLEREVTYFKFDRYFLSSDKVAIKMGNEIQFELADDSAQSETVKFIQSLTSEGVSFSFNILGESGSTNVKVAKVIFTDAKDRSKTVTIKIEKDKGVQSLFISENLTTGGYYGKVDNSTADGFAFVLRNEEGAIYDVKSSAKTGSILTFDDGRVFDGFSEKVYIAFEVQKEDASKSATIGIRNINGQTFADTTSNNDSTPPVLVVNGKVGGNYVYNDTVVIPSASASDVLSGVDESSLVVSVKHVVGTSETTVKDVNGLLLENVSATSEYTVKLDELGQYKVYYSVKDTRIGVRPDEIYTFNSVMDKKPVITLSSDLVTTAKVNTAITVPTFSVQYAQENEANIAYAIYIAPDDRYQYIDMEKATFTPTEVGVYIIRYMALDASGQYAISEYKINVTK